MNLTRDADPAVVTWMIALSPRDRYIPQPPRRHWWRELVTGHYRDARDAWERLRESEPFLQHEDDEFLAEHPPPTLGQFMVGLAQGSIAPDRGAA